MHLFQRLLLQSCIGLCCCLMSANAQLTLKLADSVSFDGSQYPLYSARLVAKLNGQPFRLSSSNLLIREDVQVSRPLSVSDFNGEEQVVRWYSRSRDVTGGFATVVAFDGNLAVSLDCSNAQGMGYQSRTPQIRLFNINYKPVREIAFGTVAASTSKTLGSNCVATSGKFDANRSEKSIRVDSIRTETPYFSVKWKGGVGCYSLPGTIYSPLDYAVDITFQPAQNQYYHDVLTIYYEGGAVERIALSGNEFPLPQRTVLNLVQPNGSEVLAPCQRQVVKWTGSLPGSTTVIEYSTDAGKTWTEAGRSMDSTFVWVVPDVSSDNVSLRVSGIVESTEEIDLRKGNINACDRLAFSPDSRLLLAAYRNSEALVWDIGTTSVQQKGSYRADGQLSSTTQAFGCGFTSASSYYVAYRSTMSTAKSDSVSFFDLGTNTPKYSIALDTSTRYSAALIDSARTFIAMVPRTGTTLQILDANNGSLLRSVAFAAPITAVSLGKSQAAVALLDGHIVVVDLSTWAIVKDYSFTGMPVMDQILMLPDNARIAVGCHASAPMVNEAAYSDGYVVDIASSQIVRTMRKSATSPICVSSNVTSRYVLFGYVAQPQAPLWDIAPNQVYSTIVSHAGSLNALSFSPSGLYLASASSSADNLKLKQFVFPEIDYSDGMIRIVRQSLSTLTATLDPTYAFSTRDSVLSLNLCNNGIVPVTIDASSFQSAAHFSLSGDIKPDTLAVGECARIPVHFSPLDTGKLTDKVHVKSCAVAFDLPVEGYAIPRSLGIPDTIDFGDVCPDVVVTKDFNLIDNADPVSIVVNRAFLSDDQNSWFTLMTKVADDTVQGKGQFNFRVQFKASGIGVQTKTLLVYYGGQKRIYSRVVLRGRGAGSAIQVVPPVVAFLTSEPQRQVVLRNSNDNPLLINSLAVVPSTAFTLDPITLPATIAPHDSLVITLRWSDTTQSSARLEALVAPCSNPMSISLQRYLGSATLSLVSVDADPTGDATIPIRLRIAENVVYGAERNLDAEFSIHPRLFLPQTIYSPMGSASITRNEIVNDKRIVGFRVRGNFPLKDTIVAEIRGAAGLAETDESAMTFDNRSAFFGAGVTTQTANGVFRLINLCGDRRIVQSNTISLLGVQPTPANEQVLLNIASSDDSPVELEIFTPTGERVYAEHMQLRSGSMQYAVGIASLPVGSYSILIRSMAGTSSSLLLIAR